MPFRAVSCRFVPFHAASCRFALSAKAPRRSAKTSAAPQARATARSPGSLRPARLRFALRGCRCARRLVRSNRSHARRCGSPDDVSAGEPPRRRARAANQSRRRMTMPFVRVVRVVRVGRTASYRATRHARPAAREPTRDTRRHATPRHPRRRARRRYATSRSAFFPTPPFSRLSSFRSFSSAGASVVRRWSRNVRIFASR